MIQARMGKHCGAYTLVMVGHSGQAPRGEDLVCAAATIAAYQAAQVARDMYAAGKLHDKPRTRLTDGNARITVRPIMEADGETAHAFYVIGTALRLLAHNYPDFISFDDTGM